MRSTPSQPPAVIVSNPSVVLKYSAPESKRRRCVCFLPYLGSGFFSSGSILPRCGYSDWRLSSYHGNVGGKIINNSGGAATVGARPSQPKLKQGGHNGEQGLGQWGRGASGWQLVQPITAFLTSSLPFHTPLFKGMFSASWATENRRTSTVSDRIGRY